MSRPFRAKRCDTHTQGVALGWYVPIPLGSIRKMSCNRVLAPDGACETVKVLCYCKS
jgi:hypothetical protein